jgi:hypothetical protein
MAVRPGSRRRPNALKRRKTAELIAQNQDILIASEEKAKLRKAKRDAATSKENGRGKVSDP